MGLEFNDNEYILSEEETDQTDLNKNLSNDFIIGTDNRNVILKALLSICDNIKLYQELPPNKKLLDTDIEHEGYNAILQIINKISKDKDLEKIDEDILLQHIKGVESKKYNKDNALEIFLAFLNNKSINNNMLYKIKEVKKYAMIRTLANNGIDVSKWIDNNYLEVKNNLYENIHNIINNHLTDILEKTRNHDIVENCDIMLDIYKNILEDKPPEQIIKYPLNDFLNIELGGIKKRELVLRSAGSGVGKSRMLMRDLAAVAIGKRYDWSKKEWITINKKTHSCMFISTELTNIKMQSMLVAIISGVSEIKINNRIFNKEERNIIKETIGLIEVAKKDKLIDFKFTGEYDFPLIKELATKGKVQNNLEFIFFDYIKANPKLTASYGSNIPEYKVLTYFTQELEVLTNELDIGILTSTQINHSDIRGQMSLADSKGIANAVHVGIQVIRPTKDEKQILINLGLAEDKEIFGYYIYKNRCGRSDFYTWFNINRGNMLEENHIATGSLNNANSIETLAISNNSLVSHIVDAEMMF